MTNAPFALEGAGPPYCPECRGAAMYLSAFYSQIPPDVPQPVHCVCGWKGHHVAFRTIANSGQKMAPAHRVEPSNTLNNGEE